MYVLRKRMEYPKLKLAAREQREAFEVRVVLIEDQASGTRLIEELGLRRPPHGDSLSPAVGQDHVHARPDEGRCVGAISGSSMGFGSTWSSPGA
jgi:hypothetical protein